MSQLHFVDMEVVNAAFCLTGNQPRSLHTPETLWRQFSHFLLYHWDCHGPKWYRVIWPKLLKPFKVYIFQYHAYYITAWSDSCFSTGHKNAVWMILLLTRLPLDKMAAVLTEDNFKCIFLNETEKIAIRISLKFVSVSLIDNEPALVPVLA